MEALKNLQNLQNLQNLESLERQNLQIAKEEIKTTTTTAEIQEIEIKKNLIFIEVISFEAFEAFEIACNNLIKECQEGLQDTLKQFYYLRLIEDTVQKAIKELQPIAINNCINMPKEDLRRLYSMEIGYTAEILDYSDDEIINELERKIKERKEKLKLARTLSIIDEETGEIIKPPVIKTPSKPYLRVLKGK